MKRKAHKRIEIKSADDFNDIANDILTEWLEDFTERDGLTRKPTDEDYPDFDFEVEFMYTQKGMKLYDRACKRIFNLGLKYFDENELNIKSCAVLFP